MSDELGRGGRDHHEERLVGWQRPNVLRALAPPTAEDAVLEVGSAAGTVTRWLAEHGCLVDGLEPGPAMADAARHRCHDLDNAWVVTTRMGEMPAEPAYDLVVDIEGLAHVGHGAADPTPYVQRLQRLAGFAAPGGSIVFGVHNRLGAAQLAGAADPFTGKPWDGPNEYPTPPPGRGFSRAEVRRLMDKAGLRGRILGVAPDLVSARMVFADELLDVGGVTRALAWQVPSLPSPDLHGPRAAGPDELSLWRSLVDSGVGADFAPAFLVIASPDDAHERWWPEARLGAFWTMQRRARFCAESFIVRRPHLEPVPGQSADVHIDRRAMDAGHALTESTLTFRPDGSEVLTGVAIQEILAGCPSVEEAKPWIELYASKVGELEPDDAGRLPVDAVTFNLLFLADGSTRWIDQEWWMARVSRSDILGRGILATTLRLAQRGTIALWGGGVLGEVALALGRHAGLEDDAWLARAIVLDAGVQTQVCHRSPDAPDALQVTNQIREQMVQMVQAVIPGAPGTATTTGGFRLGRG